MGNKGHFFARRRLLAFDISLQTFSTWRERFFDRVGVGYPPHGHTGYTYLEMEKFLLGNGGSKGFLDQINARS